MCSRIRPSRNLFNNTHKSLNIIHHCFALKHNAALLSVDFEKASDSVKAPYTVTPLQHMVFDDNFQNAIYPSSQVKIKGFQSSFFLLKRDLSRRPSISTSVCLSHGTVSSFIESFETFYKNPSE